MIPLIRVSAANSDPTRDMKKAILSKRKAVILMREDKTAFHCRGIPAGWRRDCSIGESFLVVDLTGNSVGVDLSGTFHLVPWEDPRE